MGRKIPGKKHKKIKDPEVQRRNRLKVIEAKINNPPPKGKEDEQEIPKSLLKIMELKEKAKKMVNRKRNKRNKRSDTDAKKKSLTSLSKAVTLHGKLNLVTPSLEQGEKEPVRQYLHRIKTIAMDLAKQASFEKTYNVAVKRDSSGAVTEIRKERRSKKPKLSEKRRERELKKRSGLEPEKDFVKSDSFEFGEVVHRPPTVLTAPSGKLKYDPTSRKPGKTDLLLKQVLAGDTENVIDKKKPNNLDLERQEKRRIAVVEAFRKIKKSRRGENR